MSGMKAAYFPAVENEEQLADVLSRAAWFLTFSQISEVVILVTDRRLAAAEWRVAPGMDPGIAQRFGALRELVSFVTAESEADMVSALDKTTIVLRWKQDPPPSNGSGVPVRDWLASKQVFEVDPQAIRQEGGNYIDVGFKLMADRPSVIAAHGARFRAIAERIGKRDRAFVLATGPSVGEYTHFEYEGSLGVVCNTAILNDALMEAVRPEFVVFADPIFHFGPSQFAASFRKSLLRASERYGFEICIPLKYLPVFEAAVPDLSERTVAIPFRKDRAFNFDLAGDFELRTTANVLTFLMLPLATTFADRVSILGCDGRPLSEDGYFWRHNPKTQINDKMANIRKVHPGFFAIDYNDYYLEHCATLEEVLRAGEDQGIHFESLAESHIPALKARRAQGPHPHVAHSSTNGSGATPRPRLLVIDSTRVGAMNATGQVKKNLLGGWPDECFLQVCAPVGDHFTIALKVEASGDDIAGVTQAEVLNEVAKFGPEVIYYRPTTDLHPGLQALADEIFARHAVPVVAHLMDDWPGRLAGRDESRGRQVDRELRKLLGRSSKALSISEKMSEAFGERYGVRFEAVANGIDPVAFRAAQAEAETVKALRPQVVLRYCGAIAKDMTFTTLVDVATAVDSLVGDLPIRFEVYTSELWRAPFEEGTRGLRGVHLFESVPDEEYPALLATADVLVLAYNFDEDSLRYIGLSMPNKLPEYLASGAAVLAVGPRQANGIDYVLSEGLGSCVTERDPAQLASAVRRLAADSSYREELASAAQAWAFEHLDIGPISARFQAILSEAGVSQPGPPLLGPYSREEEAKIDEGDVIARLAASPGKRGVLVDVGAHHGSSLSRYAKGGWTVLACEPDSANRERLLERFGSAPNVTIDARAVSDAAAEALPFYSSEQSSGISSLHAFHESHEEQETVSVTTVADLAETYGLPRIDFLKIDVEGLDWKVLKGVPWERIQPDVIECEFEDLKTAGLGYSYADMADYLIERGYAVYLSEWHPIVRYGIRHQWRALSRYPAPLGSPEAWGNLLAFRDDPGPGPVAEAFSACLEVQAPGPRLVTESSQVGSAVPELAAPAPIRPDSLMASAPAAKANAPGPLEPALPSKPSAKAYAPAPVRADPPVARRSAARPAKPALGGSRYERFYIRAGAGTPLLFAAGRFAMWCARKARRYPLLTLVYAALIAGALLGGLLGEPSAPWGSLAGVLVGVGLVVALTGFNGFLIKEARHELEILHLSLRRRVERAEQSLRSHPQAMSKLQIGLDRLRADQEGGRTTLQAELAELGQAQRATREALAAENAGPTSRADVPAIEARLDEELRRLRADAEATRGAIETKLAELGKAQAAAREALAGEIARLLSRESVATIEAKIEQVQAAQQLVQGDIAELRGDVAEVADSNVSIDVVSALRHAHRLWAGEGGEPFDFEPEKEHGHAVMMALLTAEAGEDPSALKGRTLVEIGTTRERDPRQGSTEKLAVFTGLTGMRFVTVDMDSLNTKRVRGVIQYLNPFAQAVTQPGESFLVNCEEPLDYVYLDAFDFEHGQHSEERKQRYRQVLGTEIQDEACWQMHQLCAAALVTRMPAGGVVVIDDTWLDEAGEYEGKGKLAVPLLLAGGFTIIATAPRAVGLKRTEAAGG